MKQASYEKMGAGLFAPAYFSAMLAIVLAPGPAYSQATLEFIAIGDTPYSEAENQHLKAKVAPAIRDAQPPFVVHYGDLKGGGEACSESLLTERRDDVYGLLPGRVFYTPGDNEWTDCDRASLQPALSELDNLDLLRRLFYGEAMSLPDSWRFARQANFPENARWMQNGVFFVTVHLVSTNNGRVEILKDDIEAALALVEARDQANRVWMSESFYAALKVDAAAMVIVTQADVTAPNAGGACTYANRMYCDAFQSFRDNLRLSAAAFAQRGKPRKPVLLLHGDTNPYCMDKGFGGASAPNLWRLNGWGDFQSPADATVVSVDPANESEPFSAVTLLGNKRPANGC